MYINVPHGVGVISVVIILLHTSFGAHDALYHVDVTYPAEIYAI